MASTIPLTEYKLKGVLAGTLQTFNVTINPTNDIDDMTEMVRNIQYLQIPETSPIKIYKLDENYISDVKGPRNDKEEKGISVDEMENYQDPSAKVKDCNHVVLLKGAYSLGRCWSKSPQLGERIHFMVVPEYQSKV
ncbi:hypothetical protein C0992_008070 [Termitomyces sp. T32_za158]|nr:hypothetical protein C0992_008070 [Termitomyces sp. T32_za158]